MMARARRTVSEGSSPAAPDASTPPPSPGSRVATTLIVIAVVLFQATNATAMTFMALYVTDTVGLGVLWAGITLGLAAALEVPALIIIGRLGDRVSHLLLVGVGALLGVVYYLGQAAVTGPVPLLALEIPNALSVAVISGIGLALFQEIIPGAGLSTGLYMNTRRIGAIVSGPVIALAALPWLGERGVFVVGAAIRPTADPGDATRAPRGPGSPRLGRLRRRVSRPGRRPAPGGDRCAPTPRPW